MQAINQLTHNTITRMLKLQGIEAKVNSIDVLPHSQKFSVCVEVQKNGTTHILHAKEDTLDEAGASLTAQYYYLKTNKSFALIQ